MTSPGSTPKIIEITVSPTGEISVQTRGFAGASCRQATRELEKALGLVQADTPTAEFYQGAGAQEQARQSAG